MAAPKVDNTVNLLAALQPFAGDDTSVALNNADEDLDYSRLIGTRVIDHENRLGQLTSSLNTLYGYVTTLQTQMATILANGLTVPQIQLQVIMGDNAYYNVEVVVTTIGSQLNTLRTATGDSTALVQAKDYQDKIYFPLALKDQPSLSNSPTLMSGLTGWVASPLTVADTIKNMWITINDMRKAYQTRYPTSVYSNCTEAAITVTFSLYRDIPNNRITLYFLGNCNIPDGFIDTDSNGAKLTITDGSSTHNVYTTYVNVTQANKSVNGVIIDLSGTNINLYTSLSLSLVYSLTNGNLVCSNTYAPDAIPPNATPCVGLTLTPLSTTSFTGVFSPVLTSGTTYSITTYSDPTCTTPISPSSERTYLSGSLTSQMTYTIAGLTTNTTYYVRMSVAIGGNSSTQCSSIQPVKTL